MGVGVGVGLGVGDTVGVGVGGGPDCAQYLAPVFVSVTLEENAPPQIIISVPVHTAVWKSRAGGALLRLVAAQVSVAGSYLPPVFKSSAPS